MKVNFHANGFDYGIYEASTTDKAKELFASDAGYTSWEDMVELAEEFGGNTVEYYEVED
jgi:hypothetical protein